MALPLAQIPRSALYMPGAFICGDYRNIDITIRGGSIHGGGVFGNCVDPLGTFRFENIDAVTYGHAFNFETPSTPGTGADRPASGVTMILRNNTIRAWPGRPLRTIEMYHNTASGNNQPGDNYDVQVYDYQGQAGQQLPGVLQRASDPEYLRRSRPLQRHHHSTGSCRHYL